MRNKLLPKYTLKACPFCGGVGYLHVYKNVAEKAASYTAYIRCKSCKIRTASVNSDRKDEFKEEVHSIVGKWNSRETN